MNSSQNSNILTIIFENSEDLRIKFVLNLSNKIVDHINNLKNVLIRLFFEL